jgi:hypothetical protein
MKLMKKTQSELGFFPNNDNSNEILSIQDFGFWILDFEIQDFGNQFGIIR